VLEDALVLFISNFVEVIHVELSDERTEVAVSEVDGQNFLLELLDVLDGEVGSFLVPASNH
jgi:hypothetical protein